MPKHKLSIVDLFAGCGGLALGFEQAGFEPVLFSELNASAAATYVANRPGTRHLSVPDVYELTSLDRRKGRGKDQNQASNDLRTKWIPEWERQGITDIDVICGGPPCQGYSGIGHRRSYRVERQEVPSNHLYKQMVEIIKIVRPRMFLFENVRGITFGRWTASGRKGEIWEDVQEAFQAIPGYVVPNGELIEAGNYGVPQRRPRVMIVGIRGDCARLLQRDLTAPAEGLLPSRPKARIAPDLQDVLGDLVDPNYPDYPATLRYPAEPTAEIQRVYRKRRDGSIAGIGEDVTQQEYSRHNERVRQKFLHMIKHGGEIPKSMRTKKFAQRLLPRQWDDRGPTITVASLPDDFVHFEQPRILTVREWARLQTFPDWYQFCGPRTTGGHRRAGVPTMGIWEREVPRYTQIGNAVPVLLAAEVGAHFAKILRGSTNRKRQVQLGEFALA